MGQAAPIYADLETIILDTIRVPLRATSNAWRVGKAIIVQNVSIEIDHIYFFFTYEYFFFFYFLTKSSTLFSYYYLRVCAFCAFFFFRTLSLYEKRSINFYATASSVNMLPRPPNPRRYKCICGKMKG